MNDHTCTMCRYSAKQKFFGTKNTKQIPLFTTKVSCTQKERFFEILCKIGSLGCLTKCSKGHLRIVNGTYSLISQNILLSIIRYFTKLFFEKIDYIYQLVFIVNKLELHSIGDILQLREFNDRFFMSHKTVKRVGFSTYISSIPDGRD